MNKNILKLFVWGVLIIGVAVLLSILTNDSGKGDECALPQHPDDKDSCYYKLAINTRDYTFCKSIERISKRDDCLVQSGCEIEGTHGGVISTIMRCVFKDPDVCNLMENPGYKDSCYYDVAMSTNNPDLCKLITHDFNRQACITQ